MDSLSCVCTSNCDYLLVRRVCIQAMARPDSPVITASPHNGAGPSTKPNTQPRANNHKRFDVSDSDDGDLEIEPTQPLQPVQPAAAAVDAVVLDDTPGNDDGAAAGGAVAGPSSAPPRGRRSRLTPNTRAAVTSPGVVYTEDQIPSSDDEKDSDQDAPAASGQEAAAAAAGAAAAAAAAGVEAAARGPDRPFYHLDDTMGDEKAQHETVTVESDGEGPVSEDDQVVPLGVRNLHKQAAQPGGTAARPRTKQSLIQTRVQSTSAMVNKTPPSAGAAAAGTKRGAAAAAAPAGAVGQGSPGAGKKRARTARVSEHSSHA